MQKELFKGIVISLAVYIMALLIIYFGNIKEYGIVEYFSNKQILKTLVPTLTLATIPNILLFMFFIKKNWVYRARGIITVIMMMLVVMAYLKFIA